jgi:hypothetical protein
MNRGEPVAQTERHTEDADAALPSWVVGVCGVAAVASTLFSILLFLNR